MANAIENLKKLNLTDTYTQQKLKSRMELQNSFTGEFNKEIHVFKKLVAFEIMKVKSTFAMFCFCIALYLMLLTVIDIKLFFYIGVFITFGLAGWSLYETKKLKERYSW